ncbi:hypothetical protein CR194_17075 [Salipaludibacillus keqinensis]|uniref:DUF624 domain-containing protein n=1 Tax=Salipaludibacillus keqinensis TaxID=2045207 RepID=A0A323TRD5_9BACI|nr:DUF624 domain-containing protein [Salipaludibacillus keqinensis]PYZ91915.1 hypothetical protein CR194_17075 [Salipaludibacillus keqinensis]
MNKLQTVAEWIYRLAYINILWIVFSLVGMVVFGVAPATIAVYSVFQQWIKGEEIEGKIITHFFKIYKEKFFRANLLWGILLVIGFILYVDFYFIFRWDHVIAPVLLGLGMFVLILYIMVIMFSFPLIAYRNLKVMQSIKYALIYGFRSPSLTISLIISFLVIHYLIFQFPVLYLFYSVSIITYMIMLVTHKNSHKLNIAND